MKRILSISLILLISATALLGQERKSKDFDLGLGLLSIQSGLHYRLNEKSSLGVSGAAGFVFPGAYASLSPEYRYYFKSIVPKIKNKMVFNPYINATVIGMLGVNLDTPSSSKSNHKIGGEILPSIGVGFEIRYNKFYIRPVLAFAVPMVEKVREARDLASSSAFASMLQSGIGFRF